jgi:hypothetical protein
MWSDADITDGEGMFDRVRIYLPSVIVLQGKSWKPTADEVLRFVAPQLVEGQLEERKPYLLNTALHPSTDEGHSAKRKYNRLTPFQPV